MLSEVTQLVRITASCGAGSLPSRQHWVKCFLPFVPVTPMSAQSSTSLLPQEPGHSDMSVSIPSNACLHHVPCGAGALWSLSLQAGRPVFKRSGQLWRGQRSHGARPWRRVCACAGGLRDPSCPQWRAASPSLASRPQALFLSALLPRQFQSCPPDKARACLRCCLLLWC